MIRFIKKIKPRKRFINKKFLKPQSDPNDLFDLDIMTYPEMEDWDLFLIWEHSPEEWDEISTIKNKGTFKNRSNLLFQWKKDPKNTVKTFYENFSRHFSTGVVGLISHISLNDFIECSLRSKSTFQSTNYLENTRKLILKNFTQSIPKFIFRNKSKKILKHFSKKELRNDKKNTRKNIKKISKHYSLLDLFDFHKVKQPPENEYNYDILIIKEDRKNFPFFHNSFCKIEKKFLPVPQGYKELYYTGYFIIFSQSKKKDFGLQFYININNFIRNEKLISRKKFSIIKEQTIYPSLLLSKTSNLRKKKKGIKRIGKSLLKGRAIPRCFVESSKYYLKFSKIKKKKKKGLYRLAKFFFSGKGIGRNRNISLSILKKTGKKGNNKSFFDCASILTRGFGVQCDFNRASSLVQKIGKPKKVKRRTRRKIIKKKKKRKKMRKKKSHKKKKKKKKKYFHKRRGRKFKYVGHFRKFLRKPTEIKLLKFLLHNFLNKRFSFFPGTLSENMNLGENALNYFKNSLSSGSCFSYWKITQILFENRQFFLANEKIKCSKKFYKFRKKLYLDFNFYEKNQIPIELLKVLFKSRKKNCSAYRYVSETIFLIFGRFRIFRFFFGVFVFFFSLWLLVMNKITFETND